MSELSIIVPTFNDAKTLPDALGHLDHVVALASIFVEVLIVDDSSDDETLNVATEMAQRYPNLHIRVFKYNRRRQSFGGLIRFGLAHASGRYCAIVSGDGTDPVELVPDMLKRLRSGATMVVCSRYIRKGDADTVGPAYRVYQAVYRTAIRMLLGTKVTDSTYGFRAFNRIYVIALGTSSNRFSIFPEMTLKVLLSGGTVEYLAGAPQPVGVGGAEKFKLPTEIFGYASVLGRAALHRTGVRWF